MSNKVTFSKVRRRNQLLSFLIFFTLVILMFLTMIPNPWYKIPVEWYFIPVLGLVGSIIVPSFFGRHYCGQYCPTGYLADSMSTINKAGKLLKSGIFKKLLLLLVITLFVIAFIP